MAQKIQYLAKQLKISERELRDLAKSELEIKIGPKDTEINDQTAGALRKIVSEKNEKAYADGAKEAETTKSVERTVEIPSIISVKEFASRLKLPVTNVMSVLLKSGIFANINEQIDFETASIIAEDLGFKAVEEVKDLDILVDVNLDELLSEDAKNKDMITRAPVVSVMGHVDHGKTKLLDYIRGTKVADGEAGGITQKIGAYQIVHTDKEGKKRPITFLDTPGHEAFTAMRARGAKSTDIAILVVAADDGVKQQTIEAINHAKEAGIPIIVAINKIDKPGANPMKVKQELADHDLLVEEWGGQTISVEISAKEGTGISELLEYILLTADMSDLKANPKRNAIGSVLEAHLNPNLGPVGSVLIHTGTLHLGDVFWAGATYGKVRALISHSGDKVKEAGPSVPMMVTGFSGVPRTGDLVIAQKSEKEARILAEKVQEQREKEGDQFSRFGLNEMTKQAREGMLKEFKIVLKVDSKGSLEAIKRSLEKLNTDKVSVKIIHSGAGNITSSDVLIASAGKAAVFGFNVRVAPQVLKQAEYEGVDVKLFDVIYHLLETVEKVLAGMVEPEYVRTEIGTFKVLKVFYTGKDEMVVGGLVKKGIMKEKTLGKIIRDEEILLETDIISVQKGPEKVSEVSFNEECGIKLKTNMKLLPDDIIEVIELKRTLG
jgi:translation initiation factor IF-2